MNLNGIALGGEVNQQNNLTNQNIAYGQLGLGRAQAQLAMMKMAGDRMQATQQQIVSLVSSLPSRADLPKIQGTLQSLMQDHAALAAYAGYNPQTVRQEDTALVASTPTVDEANAKSHNEAVAKNVTGIELRPQATVLPLGSVPGTGAVPFSNGIGSNTPATPGLSVPAPTGPTAPPSGITTPVGATSAAPTVSPNPSIGPIASSTGGSGGSGGLVRNALGGYTNTNTAQQTNVTIVGKEGLNKGLSDLDAKTVGDARQAAIGGRDNAVTAQMILDFLPQVQTGLTGPARLEAGRILESLGLDQDKVKDFTGTNPISGQILQKEFLQLTSQAVRTMGAREPGSVISMFAKAYPSLSTDPNAVKILANAILMNQKYKEDYANSIEDAGYKAANVPNGSPYNGLKGFQAQFQRTNGPELYMTAAEAMAGSDRAWQRVKAGALQQHIIDLIPQGTQYLAPDGQMRIKQ